MRFGGELSRALASTNFVGREAEKAFTHRVTVPEERKEVIHAA